MYLFYEFMKKNRTSKQLPICQWAKEDRPREKMLQQGASALSDAELLAILIGSGNSAESAVQLSQRILHSVANNLNELGKRSILELAAGFKGIGPAKAVSIAAALELGKRRNAGDPIRRHTIKSSNDAFLMLHPALCDLPHEELWAVFTNRAGKVIHKTRISQGGLTGTVADIRIILKAAIDARASGILLCHNHPSGNAKSSPQDDDLTLRLQKAAQFLDISLLDHIIIADQLYYSYADEGKL